MNGAMVAGGCVTIYGISTMVWDVTSLFINLTPASTGVVVIFFYYYGIIIQIPISIIILSLYINSIQQLFEFNILSICSIRLLWFHRRYGDIISLCWFIVLYRTCLLYTSPSPRDRQKSRMPSSA